MKVVLANGCWDLFHWGHLLHLEAAKKLGYLVVSITEDAYVNKGPGRPIYPQQHRGAILKALKCVDQIIYVPDLLTALKAVKPDILVKGSDYTSLEPEHEAYCKEHGIAVVFTATPKLSTTGFIHAIRRSA